MTRVPHTEYSGPRSPGVRMTEPLAPGLGGPYAVADEPSLLAYHMFDKAHLVMVAEEGLIPRDDAAAMLRVLRGMEAAGTARVRRETGGGMHSGEQYLIRRLGYDVGGRIHLGRSTGDLGAVARRVRQRDRLLETMRGINAMRAAVVEVAEQHLDTVMPGYTGSQHAQPTTFGHQLLAWACILERHFARAQSAYARSNLSPAGAAILTGSSFPLDRHRTADLMGFDGVIRNTFDAIQGHDDAVETLMVAVGVNLTLSRWSNDLNFWFTSEAGYIDVPDRFCGTSSIMMQKRNPSIFPNIRSGAGEAIAALVGVFDSENTTTGEFSGDRGAALNASYDRAVQGLGWLTQLLPALKVRKERMLQMAGAYWAQATDVAAALVTEKGLPWRTAHQVVGTLVRLSYERGLRPGEVTPALLDEAAVTYMGTPVGLSAEALRQALDPVAFVARRTLYGGPAPAEAARQVPELREALAQDEAWVAAADSKLRRAAERLERAIDALVGA